MATQQKKEIRFSNVNQVARAGVDSTTTIYATIQEHAKNEFAQSILLEDVDLNKIIWPNTYIIGSGVLNVPVAIISGTLNVRRSPKGIFQKIISDDFNGPTFTRRSLTGALWSDFVKQENDKETSEFVKKEVLSTNIRMDVIRQNLENTTVALIDFKKEIAQKMVLDSKESSDELEALRKDALESFVNIDDRITDTADSLVSVKSDLISIIKHNNSQDDILTDIKQNTDTKFEEYGVVIEAFEKTSKDVLKMLEVHETLSTEAIDTIRTVVETQQQDLAEFEKTFTDIMAVVNTKQEEEYSKIIADVKAENATLKSQIVQLSGIIADHTSSQELVTSQTLGKFQKLEKMFMTFSEMVTDDSIDGMTFINKLAETSNKESVYAIDDYTMSAGDYVKCDTSKNDVALTLPANPLVDDTIHVLDIGGKFTFRPAKLENNGNNIMGLNGSTVLNIKNKEYKILFTGVEWRVI